MRTTQLIIPVLAAVLFAGCSKSPGPQSQAPRPTNAAEVAAFLTNSLDVLQAKLQEVQTNIATAQAALDELQKTYKTNDQPYLDAQHRLEQMILFEQSLTVRIEAEKMDQQIKVQAGSH